MDKKLFCRRTNLSRDSTGLDWAGDTQRGPELMNSNDGPRSDGWKEAPLSHKQIKITNWAPVSGLNSLNSIILILIKHLSIRPLS